MSETKIPVVLLVEDSDDDAFFFERSLEKSGVRCSFHRVEDGAAAVDYLRKALDRNSDSLPRVIFLDLKMPLLNGFEVLEWMRTQTFPEHIPVIVLSGSEQAEDKARAAQLGAMDYWVKPAKVRDLQRFLLEVCPREMGARV